MVFFRRTDSDFKDISPLKSPDYSDLNATLKYSIFPGSITSEFGLIAKNGAWLWEKKTYPFVFP